MNRNTLPYLQRVRFFLCAIPIRAVEPNGDPQLWNRFFPRHGATHDSPHVRHVPSPHLSHLVGHQWTVGVLRLIVFPI